MSITHPTGAVAAARFALIAVAVSSPIASGAPRTNVRGAPDASFKPAAAAAGAAVRAVGPARPPAPTAPRAVIVRVAGGRSAAAVAAGAGIAADAGGRRRRAERPAIWRALVDAGNADLAPLEPELAALEATGHVSAVDRFPIAHAVALLADDLAVRRLRAAPNVVEIAPERVHHLAEGAAARPASAAAVADPAAGAAARLAAVGAPAAWRRGLDGGGVVIAIFDAGVDWLHPALAGRYRGRDGDHNYDWMDFVDPLKRPRDVLGHGTGVAGLALGIERGGAIGVAPGAEWIAVRAFDAQGAAGDRNLLRGGEWLAAPTNLDLRLPRPDLAPDVINASWTLENGVDPLFEPILAAWRALGITAVFAAGNDDTGIGAVGTVRMPAAASDAIAVGAVDDAGRIWRLSLGGPTWDDRVKPDVVAPGVEVLTSGVDGGYDRKDGTSMAAPQVSGAAALLLSAQPDLAPDDVARFLRQSAVDGGAAGPDPVYGWGRLAADRAVDAAAEAGRVAGRVLSAAGPVPYARVTLGGGSSWTATTDAAGAFSLAVPSGGWSVRVRAMGWRAAPDVPAAVTVRDDATTALDIAVVPDAAVSRSGTVVDAWGEPLPGARIEVVDRDADPAAMAPSPDDAAGVPPAADAPIATVSDAAGRFLLQVPPDADTLRIRAAGHQAVTRTLSAGGPLSVTLRAAPRILVVDADAWMGDGQRVWPYAVRALSDAGYRLGDRVTVRALADPGGPGAKAGGTLPEPPATSPYDIVVWSHIYGSPGSMDRARGDHSVTDWLTAWLAGGRRLLVTGQDIGQWDSADGASSARLAPAFFRDVLGARYVTGDAGTGRLVGHGPLDGLALDAAWPRGYPKADRLKPDVVAPADDAAQVIAEYRSGGGAALVVDRPPGRRAYLSFGPESAGDRAALGRLFDRLMDWLRPVALRLDAAPALVRQGGPVRLTVAADGGGRSRTASLRLDRPLWIEIADADVPPDWRKADDGALTWSGALPAGAPARWALSATVHPDAAGRQPLTLTLASAATTVSVTTAVEVAAARLARASTIAVAPARLAEPGLVRVVLRVVNDGTATAVEPFVRIGQLPTGMRPVTPTLTSSSGRAEWLADPLDGLRWSGDIPPHAEITVAFDAVVDASAGEVALVRATVDSGDADRGVLGGGVRIGGPVARLAGSMRSAPPVLIAGRAATLTIPIVNVGRAPADLIVQVVLPPGLDPPERPAGRWDSATRTLTLSVVVPPGAAPAIAVPLLVDADASAGTRAIRVRIDDALSPPDVIESEYATDVRRFDLRPSRLVVSPEVVGSGEAASVTLLAGNFGDAAVDVHAALSLPSNLAAAAASVRSSAGRVRADVGGLEWDVRIAPAADDFTASSEASNAAWPPPAAGEPLPPVDAAGSRAPATLGLPFPYYADVVTRTWVTDDGLVAFGPPVRRPDPALGPAAAGVPAIAVLWRPGRRLGTPRITRSAEAWSVVWTLPERREPVAAVAMLIDGDIRLWVAPDAPVDGAVTGLNAPDGRTLGIVSAEIAGTPLRLGSPGGWARLSLDAVPGASLTPNTVLQVKALLTADGAPETVVEAAALGNRLTFDPTELSLSTDAPSPGGAFTAELAIVTDGQVAARGAEARIQVPVGAEVDPGALPADLQLVDGELVWRGRIEPGARVTLSWPMTVRAGVPAGTRLVVLARLRGDGMARTERRAAATVRGGPTPTIEKRASVGAALAGERIAFVLRAANTGPAAARTTLVDDMPAGLAFVAGSATATIGPRPTWDPQARRLAWSGDVPGGAVVEVRYVAVFDGRPGQRVSNALTVTSDDGARLTTSAEVVGASGRCYLPVAFGRR